jgi:tetratricopeptide (TPR) repeat protein
MAKIGRNEPCPCGSGRKHKHCCAQALPIPPPAPLAMGPRRLPRAERELADLQQALAQQDFRAAAEAEAYVRRLAGAGPRPRLTPREPLGRAQDLMYDAWEVEDPAERVALARQALMISTDCADAYSLLADEAAESPEEALDLFRQAVAAGERALGKGVFEQHAGHFWGILETRPYMRARFGLAQTLAYLGELDEAIDVGRDLLRLNPNDNQGVRYDLLAWFIEAGNLDAAEELFAGYEDDRSASFAYGRVLLEFVRGGPAREAIFALFQAMKTNPFVPFYLLGLEEIPEDLPGLAAAGSKEEAIHTAIEQARAWVRHPDAIEWLATVVAKALADTEKPRKKRRRRQ